eukprot:scaffold663569_cov47-Prasinocladus_malaysianus.AAC.1
MHLLPFATSICYKPLARIVSCLCCGQPVARPRGKKRMDEWPMRASNNTCQLFSSGAGRAGRCGVCFPFPFPFPWPWPAAWAFGPC